ncbi:MAG: tRNA (adenosine(37)-N6)-dimethylallyltransferase MiaA [Patescibacteria group bacterium]
MKKNVIVILGQTATGKSSLAVKLAKKINGEIISADSRQVYKGLNIGTGKITKKEMGSVPHHLLDIANPKLQFSVAEFKVQAERELGATIARGHTPIICGGTGFYIDAVTKCLVLPEVPPNQKLRKELSKKSAGDLLKILRKFDRSRANSIDPNNEVRIIRAIEIVKALGKVPKISTTPSKYEFIKIGLYLPEDKLKGKVEKRVIKMFKDGLLSEINKLKKSGLTNKRLQELGFEYYNPDVEGVITKTIQYAKRQMTWFKRDKDIIWIDSSATTSAGMVRRILKLL